MTIRAAKGSGDVSSTRRQYGEARRESDRRGGGRGGGEPDRRARRTCGVHAELVGCSGTLLPRLGVTWTGCEGPDLERVAIAYGCDAVELGDPDALVDTTAPAVTACARGAPPAALALAANAVAAMAAREGLRLSRPRVVVIDRPAETLVLYAGLRLRPAPCGRRQPPPARISRPSLSRRGSTRYR
jgi:hypothetical protein